MSVVQIKQFKNKVGDPVAGLTPEKAVYDSETGMYLNQKLKNMDLTKIESTINSGINSVVSAKTTSISEIETKKQSILDETDASLVSTSNTTSGLSGTTVQSNLDDAGQQLSDLNDAIELFNLDSISALTEGHYSLSGKKQTYQLEVISGATSAGTVTVTIDGSATSIAASAGTANSLAEAIQKGSYTGFNTSVSDNVVTFERTAIGYNPATITTNVGSTGALIDAATLYVEGAANAMSIISNVIAEGQRTPGKHICFQNTDHKLETWQYVGGTINSSSSWAEDGSTKLSELSQNISEISNVGVSDEDEAIIFAKTDGTEVVKITNDGLSVNGVSFTDKQDRLVAGNNITISGNTISAKGGEAYSEISEETTTDEDEEITIANSSEAEEYVKIGDYGVKAKAYLDLNGESIIKKSNWEGKVFAYFGTSVPAQGYPQLIGNILSATVYNQAVGSSMMRCGQPNEDYLNENTLGDDLGLNMCYFDNIMRSMSRTQKELRYIFDNWTTLRRQTNLIDKGYTEEQVANVKGYADYIGGSFPEQGTDPTISSNWPTSKPIDVYANNGETYKAFRKLAYSYCWDNSTDIETDLITSGVVSSDGAVSGVVEGRLEKFINGSIDTDLYIFDHFRNDASESSTENYLAEPVNKTDRNYAIGAFNYLVGRILQAKPNAKIVIVGHLDNDDTKVQLGHVWEAQNKVAELWGFPICKLWELLGIRAYRWVSTKGYWDSNGAWHENGYDGTNHVWKSNNGLKSSDYESPRQLEDGTWVHNLTTRMIWLRDDVHPIGNITLTYFAKTIATFINNLNI